MFCVQGGKTLLVPTPRQRTGILSQIQLPDECDEDILSKYSTRQVVNGAVSSGLFPVNLESPGINLVRKPTINYVKLLLAAQMVQGIMPNTVGKSRGISLLKLSGNRGFVSNVAFGFTNCQ